MINVFGEEHQKLMIERTACSHRSGHPEPSTTVYHREDGFTLIVTMKLNQIMTSKGLLKIKHVKVSLLRCSWEVED